MTNRNPIEELPIVEDETPTHKIWKPKNEQHARLLKDLYWALMSEDKELIRLADERIREFEAADKAKHDAARAHLIRETHRRMKAVVRH